MITVSWSEPARPKAGAADAVTKREGARSLKSDVSLFASSEHPLPLDGDRGHVLPGPLLAVFRDRRLAFVAVGIVNTIIGALWFLLFDHLIGHQWNGLGHYVALLATYVAAILCAFSLHRTLVFRVHGHLWRDLGRFATVYVSAFAVNLVLLALLVSGLHWNAFLSQCAITVVTTLFSWVGHSKFSFRRPDVERSEGTPSHPSHRGTST